LALPLGSQITLCKLFNLFEGAKKKTKGFQRMRLTDVTGKHLAHHGDSEMVVLLSRQ
jgi:hypothetical protein